MQMKYSIYTDTKKNLPDLSVREAFAYLDYLDCANQNFRGFTRTEGPMVLLRYRERM